MTFPDRWSALYQLMMCLLSILVSQEMINHYSVYFFLKYQIKEWWLEEKVIKERQKYFPYQ